MKLFSFPHHVEAVSGGGRLCRWRWTLEAGCMRRLGRAKFFHLSVYLAEEIQERTYFGTDEGWHPANRYFTVYLCDHWHLGEEHLYYDGPHCSFSLGFLHFAWMRNAHCRKCEGDEP